MLFKNGFFILYFYLGLSFELLAGIVLLDPGHGGEEFGAKCNLTITGGSSQAIKNNKLGLAKNLVALYEKDLTLVLANKIKNHINQTSKHVVYLTRSFDKTIDLNERAKIADLVQADIFISIHFNSEEGTKGQGFETYFLSNQSDVAVKKLESLENFMKDPVDDVTKKILIDLAVTKTITKSKLLATKVHQEQVKFLKSKFKVNNRGLKSAMLYVLAKALRPGVLVEAGFISNKEELSRILATDYLDIYAQSIAKGIVTYFDEKSLSQK